MKKILVIGSPGAGKSVFARKLRDVSGLPLYYLDRLFHRADKTTVSREEFDAELEKILETDRWIIDGNYLRTMEMRLQQCDTVFFLDLPVSDCLEGAASRIGTAREDMPWVETEADAAFIEFIQRFSADTRPVILEALRGANGVAVYRFKDRIDAETYLNP